MYPAKPQQPSVIPASFLALVVAMAGLVSWQVGNGQPARSASAPQVQGPRECPEFWGDSGVPGINDNINRPEFNDCQRFVLDAKGELVYDSLYAIFAADNMRRKWEELGANSVRPQPGQLFAIIYTFGGPSGAAMGDPTKGGTYESLYIDKGWNCL